jgi:DNA-binding GntR family transcriptional regulator
MAGRPRSIMETAYSEIKHRIMVLELEPGMPIDDIRISKELGVSRTPVREALFRLSTEGLIVSDSGKSGFFVRPMDLVSVSNLFEAHMVTARAISRLVAIRATKDDLESMKAAEQAVVRSILDEDPAGVASTNAHLHRLEAAAAKNSFLESLALSIHDHGQRIGFLAFGGRTSWELLKEHFSSVQRDHRELIESYEARDPDLAEEIAGRHVILFRNRIAAFMEMDAVNEVSLGGDVLPSARLD